MNIIQKLLLVDDIPENLFALESILEDDNREFIKASSGEEALKLLLKNDIDLILLDVQMPGIDGFETAQLIRGTQRTKKIPIIFVTAISKEQEHIFKGYESGAVDYMFKPLEPTIVQSKVAIFLELAKQRRLLEQQNMDLTDAKRNTDNIFTNVEEGLFLLDKSFNIKPQYSKALEEMIQENPLDGLNFLTLMQKRVDKEIIESTNDFLQLMFQEDIDEENLKQLNPLQGTPIKNKELKTEKYLDFTFKRVISNNKIDELIITVIDRTARILLKKQLKEAEEEKKKQYELMNILKLEPTLLREFLQQTEKELKEVETLLSDEINDNETEIVYRLIHSVKGNAGLLNLSFISEKAHDLEESIIEIKNSTKIDSDFIAGFILKLNEIRETINSIYDLIDQMKYFYEHFNTKSSREGQLMIKAAEDLLSRLNDDLEKETLLNSDIFDTKLSFGGNFLLIKDILVQLIRNSMVHGIESPLKREQKGKPRKAVISLSGKAEKDNIIIKLKDDGQGLQLDKIRDKALASKKWTADELSQWNDEKIADLIFESGISTAEKTNLTAGRGIGMGIVKQKIDDIKGSININYKTGEFTEFTIKIPAAVE